MTLDVSRQCLSKRPRTHSHVLELTSHSYCCKSKKFPNPYLCVQILIFMYETLVIVVSVSNVNNFFTSVPRSRASLRPVFFKFFFRGGTSKIIVYISRSPCL
jgi:hypothetical protein